MAHKVYIGNESGLSKNVGKIYLGDTGGISRKVKKGYIGDIEGKARLFFTSDLKWAKYESIFHEREYNYQWKRYDTVSGWTLSYGTSGRSYLRYGDIGGYVYTRVRATASGPTYSGSLRITESNYGSLDVKMEDSDTPPQGPGGWSGSATGHFMDDVALERVSGVVEDLDSVTNPNTIIATYTGKKVQSDCNWATSKTDSYTFVYSTNKSNWPDEDYEGDYYYEYVPNGGYYTEEYYSKGDFIGYVEAPEGTYPTNGRASDGYWYVLQST